METGITHGPDVRGGHEMLSQACQVDSPLPGIPLVQNILRVKDILKEEDEEASNISLLSTQDIGYLWQENTR